MGVLSRLPCVARPQSAGGQATVVNLKMRRRGTEVLRNGRAKSQETLNLLDFPLMRARVTPPSATVLGAVLLMAASLTAVQNQQAPSKPAGGAETRDRYLNPRETDLSLSLDIDPKEVPDIPPVEPDRALATFRLKKGFRLELVAHEPEVVDPIQLAFDEDGRLYVVEMRWYQSEMRTDLMFDERIGRIRLLEDLNGDGRFDKSTVFADRLRYPSAVIPYDGGVYVGLEPDIVFLKDRNGDGVADFRQVVFTGFGNQRDRLDSQMFLNSLTWGLDNRIHGAKGHGGTITAALDPQQAPLDLRGRDFSFDPRTHRMRAESGGGKTGPELRQLRPEVREHGEQRGAVPDVPGSLRQPESILFAASRERGHRPGAGRDRRIARSSIASAPRIRGAGFATGGAPRAFSPARHRSRRRI